MKRVRGFDAGHVVNRHERREEAFPPGSGLHSVLNVVPSAPELPPLISPSRNEVRGPDIGWHNCVPFGRPEPARL